MNDAKALAEIKRLAAGGQVRFTMHAHQRMRQRRVFMADVFSAIDTATTAEPEEADKYLVAGGVDVDGDDLRVIVAIEADLVIITVI